MSKSIKIKSRLMVIRNRRNRGIGNNHSLDVEFYFVVIKMFWNERWWLHSIVYILAAVELLTFKWLILCEFYLNFFNEKNLTYTQRQGRGNNSWNFKPQIWGEIFGIVSKQTHWPKVLAIYTVPAGFFVLIHLVLQLECQRQCSASLQLGRLRGDWLPWVKSSNTSEFTPLGTSYESYFEPWRWNPIKMPVPRALNLGLKEIHCTVQRDVVFLIMFHLAKRGLFSLMWEVISLYNANRTSKLYLFSQRPSHFPGGSDGKESTWNTGDLGLIPGLGRSPGEGKGYPLQYSCLDNSMGRGAWWGAVYRVAKSDTTEWLHTAWHKDRHDHKWMGGAPF